MISIDRNWRGARHAAALAAVFGGLCTIAAPAMAGPLVVNANGPSAAAFKPGKRLPDAPLVLKAGDVVTVLDSQGTRNFTGPGRFDFTAASQVATPVSFTQLLTQKPERRARIGAVRGIVIDTSIKPEPPGVWAIDSGTSGTVCALDASKISVWRADPTAAGKLVITRSDDGKSADVAFDAGQAVAAWPATLAPAAGQSFAIGSGAKPVRITFKLIGESPKSLDGLGEALIASGCESQFARLARATSTGDD